MRSRSIKAKVVGFLRLRVKPKTVSAASPPPAKSRRTVTPPWPCVTLLPATLVILIAAAESGFRTISAAVSAPGLSARGSQPTSAVAVRGQPPAELQIGELALPVGKCLRNPIHEDLDAAHRELRAGAEAANRDTLVEREIVAVGRVHARDGDQGFVQPPRGAGAADLGLVDQVHGERGLADRRIGAGYGDDGGRPGGDPEAGARGAGGGPRAGG